MEEKKIRIALTKGRLEKKTLTLLEQAGYDVHELRENTRRLIFSLPGSNVELVLAKAADVITYVEHGACDMGVVGKDTIMEQGGSYYEVMDLGFGRCRFALAGKTGQDFYQGYHTRRQMDVQTIKIEGSVELTPLLGLADAIVDIVETGSTLRENGLCVYEDIAPVSARLIVNIASMKMKQELVQPILRQLQEQLEDERGK